MASYEALRQRSLTFVKQLLLSAQSATYDLRWFKIPLPPVIAAMDIEVVRLIEETAKLLPDYNGDDIDDVVRESVLKGMYCYVEMYYHLGYTAKLYQTLFNQINTEIGTLDSQGRLQAIRHLQSFCGWITENLENLKAKKLWEAMPQDMQVVLENYLNGTSNETSSFLQSIDTLSHKATQGFNTLFK